MTTQPSNRSDREKMREEFLDKFHAFPTISFTIKNGAVKSVEIDEWNEKAINWWLDKMFPAPSPSGDMCRTCKKGLYERSPFCLEHHGMKPTPTPPQKVVNECQSNTHCWYISKWHMKCPKQFTCTKCGLVKEDEIATTPPQEWVDKLKHSNVWVEILANGNMVIVPEKLRDFITSLLHSERERIVKGLEGMRKECSNCGGLGYTVIQGHGCGGNEERCSITCPIPEQEQCNCQYQEHNSALSSAIALIENK